MKLHLILETAYANSKVPPAARFLRIHADQWRVTGAVCSGEWAAVEVEVTDRALAPAMAALLATTGIEAALEHDGLTLTRADVDGKQVTLLN